MTSPTKKLEIHTHPTNDLEIETRSQTEPSTLETQAKSVQNYLEQPNSPIHVVKSYSPDHNLQLTGLDVKMLANQAKKKPENVQEISQHRDDFIRSKIFAIMSKVKLSEIRKNINKNDPNQINKIVEWSKNQIGLLTSELNKTTHKGLTSIIQGAITKHQEFIKYLNEIIKHPPPPLMAKKIKDVTKIKDNSLLGNVSRLVNKCVDWFFELFQPAELKNLNSLLGKYKQISHQDFLQIKKVFSDENFSQSYQELSMDEKPSLKAFYTLVEELKLIQEE